MNLHKIFYILRSIHFSGILQALQNSLLRDRLDRKYTSKVYSTDKLLPGQLSNSTRIQGGIQLEFAHAKAEYLFLSSSLIRVSWEPGVNPVPCTIAKSDWELEEPNITKNATGLSLTGKEIAIKIDEAGNTGYYDHSGKLLKQDLPPFQNRGHWLHTSLLMPEEHIYGLGERAGHLNLRPGKYTSWNIDVGGNYSHGSDPLYIGTPIYLSMTQSGCHAVYFENSFRSIFTMEHQLEAEFSGGMLRYYVIFGTLDQIYRQLGNLVGFACMPPRWALGYHQSRWGYKSEAEIRSVIDGFAEHDLPISAIHLDIDYMNGFRLFTFNPKRYPDIKHLTSELQEKGIKTVVSINPAVKVDTQYELYNDGISKDVFCTLPDGEPMKGVSWPGWSVFPDFANPAVRSWWQVQYKFLLENGIAGFWHDMNEPASFTAWGDKTFPRSTQHEFEGRKTDHAEIHNLYGLLMNQAAYEALQSYEPNKRPWILTRAGWASLQRYAWNWTGDIESTWETLQQTIPTILGLGLSGHAFSGPDIGGFSGSPSAELYLRWFQLSTFLPFFRTHSSLDTKSREPWSFGEPTTSIVRKFLQLRYMLIPYLYTLAWESCQSGVPPVRPLFWESPDDKLLWSIEDEFMLGESMLIAPILRSDVDSRMVVFPSGEWYSYWDDRIFTGPSKHEVAVNLDEIPVFIKGGTILPMEEAYQLILHFYPGKQDRSTSRIYSDAGDGYGSWREDLFTIEQISNGHRIIWDKTGDYPFPSPTIKLVTHGLAVKKVLVDGNINQIRDNYLFTPAFTNLELFYA